MSLLVANPRHSRIAALLNRGRTTAQTLMQHRCSIQRPRITLGGQEEWDTVIGTLPCRIRRRGDTRDQFAQSDADPSSRTFAHAGEWRIIVPLNTNIQVGDRAIDQTGTIYYITGQATDVTHEVERTLTATTHHDRGDSLLGTL